MSVRMQILQALAETQPHYLKILNLEVAKAEENHDVKEVARQQVSLLINRLNLPQTSRDAAMDQIVNLLLDFKHTTGASHE